MRILKLFILCLIFSAVAKAQLTEQWSRNYGINSPFITFPFKAFVDNSGNVYSSVLSYFNISAEVGDTLWILKYNSDGDLLWNIPFIDGEGSIATDFRMDADSNILILMSNFPLGGGSTSKSFNVVKMDTAGSILWNRHFDDSLIYSHSNLISLIPGSQDIIVTNWARGNSSQNVVYARRLDGNGNQLWRYTDTLRLDPGPQWVDNNGFFHFTSQEKLSLLQQRMTYKKIDLNGQPIDSFILDHGFGSFCKFEDNIYVNDSGSVFINAIVQATTLNIYNQLLLQLDANGDSVASFEDANLITKYMSFNPVTNQLYLTVAEGTNFTPLRSSLGIFNGCTFVDTNNFAENVHVIDQFINPQGEMYTLNFFDRICKFDMNGNLLWIFNTPEFVNNLDQDRFNYRIIQDYNSKAIYYMYADKLVTTDDHGVWHIVKYIEESTVDIQDGSPENNVVVFPNPSNGNIKVMLKNFSSVREISVMNLIGGKVYTYLPSVISSQFDIQLPELSNGVYFVRIISDTGFATGKIVYKN